MVEIDIDFTNGSRKVYAIMGMPADNKLSSCGGQFRWMMKIEN